MMPVYPRSKQPEIGKFLLAVFLLTILAGCVKEPIKPPADFRFVKVKSGDTLQSLAQTHLGSRSLAWRIAEFNGISEIAPGGELIIPLHPFRPGGLTATGHQLVPVLSYHNFTSGFSHSKLTVSARDFDDQMGYLQDHGYHVLSLDELLEYLRFGQVPRKSVLVTMDDGWISCYSVAYPILKKYGFNAVLFIPTNYIKPRSSRTLSWDQIREMVNDSTIDIQCHSKSHKDLNAMKHGESFAAYLESVKNELVISKKIILEELGKQATALAYPYGNTNPVVMEILKKNGYTSAFTVKRAGNPFYMHNLRLHRSMIYGTFRLDRFVDNLEIFQDYPLENPEPIDTMNSISEISYGKPSEYEAKGQWRTALLAWKLRRDWLISHQDSASMDYKFANLTGSDDLLKEATQKTRELEAKILSLAAGFFSSAIKTDDTGLAHQLLLRTLLYDPNHKPALEMLKNGWFNQQLVSYWVRNDDTLQKIARHLYHDSGKAVLISLFNKDVDTDSDLVPGMKLTLPSAAALRDIKVDGSAQCHIVLTKPARQLAEDLYNQANELFNQDKVNAAIAKLRTAICLNPQHQQAKDMLEMLEHL